MTPFPERKVTEDEVNQGAILIAIGGGGDFFMGKAEMDRKTKEHYRESPAEVHSSRFFQNMQCEYFPCHDMEDGLLNCLFCYCPLYHESCPGEARVVQVGDKEIKDCSRCEFPHKPGNYDAIIAHLMAMLVARG